MNDTVKKDKAAIFTFVGMAVMTIAVAIKAATSSVIAAAAIHIAGLACFFIIEGIEKFPRFSSVLFSQLPRRILFSLEPCKLPLHLFPQRCSADHS